MINREVEKELKIISKEFPVVAILGPRQSGKTTLAQKFFTKHKYISMEDLDIRQYALNDPKGFLSKYKKNIIIDEFQHVPNLLSYLQTHIDSLKEEGIFILTGSHNYLMMEKISQSLAGRVGIITLLPCSIKEIKLFNKRISVNELIYNGFYPRLYDKKIRPHSFYKSYLNTYIERDVRLLKNISDYNTFAGFVKIMAGYTGQILNTKAIADDCGISHNTVKAWLSILETSYIIYRLPPYYKNFKKRIIKNPKIYFYDTGLVCYLLSIKSSEEFDTHYLRGSIFETFIISEIMKYLYNHYEKFNLFYWRDNHKKEIDLIIDNGDTVKSLEIKSSHTFNKEMTQGLKYWSKISSFPLNDSYLVYRGDNDMLYNNINVINWRKINTIWEKSK